MKHTPGPWEAKQKRGLGTIIVSDRGEHIATIYSAKDAAPIAATADLLAALRRALDAGIGGDGRLPSPADEARAAIAKATGEEKR